MASLIEITTFLSALLQNDKFNDSSLNGLQVESKATKIEKVALAVDAGLSVIEQAVKENAQLLIVHHGLFWGQPLPIVGALAKKISLLLEKNCSLYASHLPVDSHLQHGNAAQLALYLDLQHLEPFCEYKGATVGIKASNMQSKNLEWFVDRCKEIRGAINPIVLPFGKKEIKSVGIVTGSGAFALSACAAQGLDLLISGEAKHEAYHLAKEIELNAIFAGHYATETFGVQALGRELEKKYKVETVFIHEGSGI